MAFDSDLGRIAPDYNLVLSQVGQVLQDNALSSAPVTPIQIAENYGLRVLFASFPGSISDVMGYLDLNSRSIVVNKNDPANRQTFTIAHELGHYQLHQKLITGHPDKYKVLRRGPLGAQKVPIEQEANSFAGNLLVPRFLLDRYRKIASVAELARLFVVSEEAIRWRFVNERWPLPT